MPPAGIEFSLALPRTLPDNANCVPQFASRSDFARDAHQPVDLPGKSVVYRIEPLLRQAQKNATLTSRPPIFQKNNAIDAWSPLLSYTEVVQFLSIVFAWLFCASLQLIEPKQVLGENHETGLAGCSA